MNAESARFALRPRSFLGDRIAWALFLVLVAGVAIGTRTWLHRRVVFDQLAALPTLDFRLPVLAFERVGGSAGERNLPPARVAEHLEALAAAGFVPVSLRQVRDAYRTRQPLPERAILLTFEGGHLSTYEAVDPMLRARRWPAVMFVDPRLSDERHATYLYWDRLQRMVDSGIWDLATLGPWPESATLLERNVSRYQVLATTSAAARSDGGRVPELAFQPSPFGVNDPFRDPLQLMRVRVSPSWSGPRLADRTLEALQPPGATSPGRAVEVSESRWVETLGALEQRDGTLRLTGAPRAEAWIGGAEWARDFVFEAEVRPERGVFWIVQQAISGGEQWRCGGTDKILYVQRIRPGAPIEVVAQVGLHGGPGPWHSIRIVKRGGGIWVEWDGAPVEGTPRPVPGRWRGPVGIATGSARLAGEASFRNVRFGTMPYEIRPVSASPSEGELAPLIQDAAQVAAISPSGLVAPGGVIRPDIDRAFLGLVAAQGAWDVLPALEPSADPAEAAPAHAARWAAAVEHEGWAGLRVTPALGKDPSVDAWRAAAPSWRRIFEDRGLHFVLDVPTSAGGGQ